MKAVFIPHKESNTLEIELISENEEESNNLQKYYLDETMKIIVGCEEWRILDQAQ